MWEQVKMPIRHFLRSDIFTFVMVYSFYFRLFSPNELNSYPLTFDWLLVIVRLLIRLTEVSGMNHMKYKTLIADRLGNSCLDAGFFISDKIIFYPISLIRSNFKSLLSHVLKKMFFQTCSKERKIKL